MRNQATRQTACLYGSNDVMRPLMVLGCTSDAGKSLLVTALCRWFARQGVNVAPFKAQNMSNNARVVAHPVHGSGEIGVAQWLQALAAGRDPDVRMNPVLLKPEADNRSQVIVRGQLDRELSATPWSERHDRMWGPMAESFELLADDADLVILEGAGSPAEINLRDQVNNRMLEYVDGAALLASDIDRGGSFAHLYGTWALVPPSTQSRLQAFVLNRFRGDQSLLAPGPQILTERTGMANAGVMPMLRHNLPREEGASEISSAPAGAPRVIIPRLPFGSNLDEFHLLAHAAQICWATSAAQFRDLDPERDLVVLPGSKHVVADYTWLEREGLVTAIRDAAASGVRTVGICAGAMMMGHSFSDPDGIESPDRQDQQMLGLLPHRTVLGADKRVKRSEIKFGDVPGLFTGLSDQAYDGYEIRNGQISDDSPVVATSESGPVAWGTDSVLATTVHGLFETSSFITDLLGVTVEPVLEATFELLADAVENHLDTDLIHRLTTT